MLRNDYIQPYLKSSKYPTEEKYTRDDNENFLKSYRPLSEKTIEKLNSNMLKKFVDDLLTNEKTTQVLYSTNTKAEINKYLKSNEVMHKNRVKMKYQKVEFLPSDAIKNRNKKDAIVLIRGELDNFNKRKNETHKNLKKKCDHFYYEIKSQRKNDIDEYYNPINDYRIKKFNQELLDIQKKLEENKLSNRRAFKLPTVKLNMNDVYSRLYHNSVLLTGSTERYSELTNEDLPLGNGITKTETSGNNPTKLITKKNPVFNVKNVIQSTNGKEFTIKISEELIMKCFCKHSGGPTIHIKNTKFKPTRNIYLREGYLNLLEMTNSEGNTLLHISVLNNFPDLLEYLLGKGVYPNVQNNEGDTPLHLAIRKDYRGIIKLLMSYNAEIGIVNKKNETPFDIANSEIKKEFDMENIMMSMSQTKTKT